MAALIGCTLMAFLANVPLALAPGMGTNAFFAFTVASGPLNLGVETALIATFISGLLYVFIAISPARLYINKLLPKNIKLGIGAMIGLFLAYIGLVDSGIIVSDAHQVGPGKIASASLTKLGNFANPLVIIALITLVVVFVLHFMKVKGAAVLAMILAVIMLAIAKGCGVTDAGKAFNMNSYHSFSKFGQLSRGMWSSFTTAFAHGKFYIAVFVFLYIDFFDTTGTLFTLNEQGKFNKNKAEEARWIRNANLVDALSTMSGSILLTSTTTTFLESSVGVSQGAKTGLASLVTASMFGLAILVWPIMGPILPIHATHDVVPASTGIFMPVTGPILVLVGALMISQLKNFDWAKTVDIPTMFVTLVFGMLSYSISTGVAAGIIMFAVMNSAAWVATNVNNKKGRDFFLDDETFDLAETKNLPQEPLNHLDYRRRVLNPVIFVLLVLAITYFATLPLYAY